MLSCRGAAFAASAVARTGGSLPSAAALAAAFWDASSPVDLPTPACIRCLSLGGAALAALHQRGSAGFP